jgi:polyhydroxybutyrate depolymerase
MANDIPEHGHSMKHCIINCFAIILLSTLPLATQANNAETSPGWHEFTLEHDGVQRYFRVYVPLKLNNRPDLVMLFHGGTQSMRKIFRARAGGTQEWTHLTNDNGFLLLVPNGVNLDTGDTEGDKQNWNDCRVAVNGDHSASSADDVGFVNDLISWMLAHYQINESRVYATGASNGGMMSLRLVTELGDKLAAAAVFIANQPVESDCIQAHTPVPLLMMSGTKDPLMRWDGGQIRGKGPVMMSAPATLDYWLGVNHADKDQVVTELLPDVDTSDDSMIIKNIYPAKSGGQPLWFYQVLGGGHTLPSKKHRVPFVARVLLGSQNRDLEGADEAWNFLRRFSKENSALR